MNYLTDNHTGADTTRVWVGQFADILSMYGNIPWHQTTTDVRIMPPFAAERLR